MKFLNLFTKKQPNVVVLNNKRVEKTESKPEIVALQHSHARGSLPRRFTLAAVVLDGNLQIGYAICSEKDKQFNRQKGRKIAVGRAEKRPIMMMAASEKMEDNKAMFKSIFKDFPKRNSSLFVKPKHCK